MAHSVRIGTAGWSIPRAWQDSFPVEGSHLQRYAARLNAVEINSSFYRPHRRETYQRWATEVGPDFRFAVKMPRTITHERRLVDTADAFDRFVGEIGGLAEKLGAVLVQLPPSLVFKPDEAVAFLRAVSHRLSCPIVLEPRHPSWFAEPVDALLADLRIARVAADPPLVPTADRPGGWRGFAYFRLHGSPRLYWSDYAADALTTHTDAASAAAASSETWLIYDNTASGFATGNALAVQDHVKHDSRLG